MIFGKRTLADIWQTIVFSHTYNFCQTSVEALRRVRERTSIIGDMIYEFREFQQEWESEWESDSESAWDWEWRLEVGVSVGVGVGVGV